MTSEVGTDLRAVRPPGTGLVVLTVESACSGEWRYFVMFAGVALSEKSPYLGGSRVWLSLWQEPGMWPEDLRGRFRACPLCGPFPLEVRGGCSPMTSEVGTDLRAVRPCFGLSLAWGCIRGWSKGGAMGKMRGYSHAISFLAARSGAGLAFRLAPGLVLWGGGLSGLRGDWPCCFSTCVSAECDRYFGR